MTEKPVARNLLGKPPVLSPVTEEEARSNNSSDSLVAPMEPPSRLKTLDALPDTGDDHPRMLIDVPNTGDELPINLLTYQQQGEKAGHFLSPTIDTPDPSIASQLVCPLSPLPNSFFPFVQAPMPVMDPFTMLKGDPRRGRPKTTLCIRNVDKWITQPAELADSILDKLGFGNPRQYDFLYLAINFENMGNKRYAFVNCVSHQAALRMKQVLDSSGYATGWAREQGTYENVLKQQHCPNNNRDEANGFVVPEKYQPMLWVKLDGAPEGVYTRVPFPKPEFVVGNFRPKTSSAAIYKPNGICPHKVFIASLPRDVDEGDLRRVLEAYGKVDSVVIVRDSRTGIPRGYGYAGFEDETSVKRLLKDRMRNTRHVEVHKDMGNGSIAVLKPYSGTQVCPRCDKPQD